MEGGIRLDELIRMVPGGDHALELSPKVAQHIVVRP